MMRVLYAGDSPVGGAANYLLGVLKSMNAKVTHIPPAEKLTLAIAQKNYDVILLSDYESSKASLSAQRALIKQVQAGSGLMMIGGWASFTGLWGKWKGSPIETILPVRCSAKDDRLNIPVGALVQPKEKQHLALKKLNWQGRPVICGLNTVTPKAGKSRVLLSAAEIKSHTRNLQDVSLGREYPLLVVSQEPQMRVLALATDVAPHWCGGLVDWGTKRVKLPVTSKIAVEVGDQYVQFLSGLLSWLANKANG